MTPLFERVAIIGVGLLGASLGLALKSRGLAGTVVGVGHRQSTMDTALRVGAIDDAVLDPRQGVQNAGLIVIATPAARVINILDDIQSICSPHAYVTDVASTKAQICAHAAARWPQPRRFVGSHPMAGSEKFGPEHGRPDFYEHSICLVERAEDLDPEAHAAVIQLWRAIGANVVEVEPARHDLILAHTSHLPHVAAAALATLAAGQGAVSNMIGQGFRDVTRIAASRPEVWRDICLTNREALMTGIEGLQQQLHAFSEALAQEDAQAIESFFEEGREGRRRVAGP